MQPGIRMAIRRIRGTRGPAFILHPGGDGREGGAPPEGDGMGQGRDRSLLVAIAPSGLVRPRGAKLALSWILTGTFLRLRYEVSPGQPSLIRRREIPESPGWILLPPMPRSSGMIWAIFALLGAFLDAGYYALVKRSLASLEDEVIAAGTFLSSSAILLALSLVKGIPPLGPSLVPSVIATGTLNVIAAFLVYDALRRTDLSLAVPVITFTLVFLMGTSFLLLGEVPTAAGAAGILLIVSGAILMHSMAGRSGFLQPMVNIVRDRGVMMMLVVAFLYSLSLPFDKAVVLASDTIFGSSLVLFFVGIVFLSVSLARGSLRRAPPAIALPLCLGLGLVLSLEAIAINLAYTLQIVPYVIAVKRLSILFSVLIGGIVFREEGIKYRILGALIMIGGVALIVLTTVPGSILS
jgi:drug/metabolite transporter (DMT)-like permease